MDKQQEQNFQRYYEQQKQQAGAVTYGEELDLVKRLQEETKQGIVPISATQRIRGDPNHPAVQAIREGKVVSLEGAPPAKTAARPKAKRNALLAMGLLTIPLLLLVAWLIVSGQEETAVVEGVAITVTPLPTQTITTVAAVVEPTMQPTDTPQPTYTPVPIDVQQFDIVPEEPETLANTNNPIALSFAGREMRVTEATLAAAWEPVGVEWWPGTHVRRVIALPYEKALVDAAFGLIGQPITLRLRTGTLVQYELQEIQRRHAFEIEHLTSRSPSLALIFYGEEGTDERWLLIGEAIQQGIAQTATPIEVGEIPDLEIQSCELSGSQLRCTIRSSRVAISQLHLTDMAWASAWEQTPPTVVLSEAQMEGTTIAQLSGVVQSAETAVIMTAETVQPLSIHLTDKGE